MTEFSIDGDVSTDSEGATVITISYTEGEITKTADITITVVASGSEPSEPTDVTLIEALVLNGQYVNTEYVPNLTSRLECLFDSTYVTQYGTIYGADNIAKVQWRNAGDRFAMIGKGMTKNLGATNGIQSPLVNAKAVVNLKDASLQFNDNYNASVSGGTQEDTTFSVLLGSSWFNNEIEKPVGINTIKEFKIYENDVLIKDFKPATKNGVEGMYDTISGTFYPAVTYEA